MRGSEFSFCKDSFLEPLVLQSLHRCSTKVCAKGGRRCRKQWQRPWMVQSLLRSTGLTFCNLVPRAVNNMKHGKTVVSIIPYHETRAPCNKNGAEQVPTGPRRGAGDTRLFYRGRATVGSLHHNETGASIIFAFLVSSHPGPPLPPPPSAPRDPEPGTGTRNPDRGAGTGTRTRVARNRVRFQVNNKNGNQARNNSNSNNKTSSSSSCSSSSNNNDPGTGAGNPEPGRRDRNPSPRP